MRNNNFTGYVFLLSGENIKLAAQEVLSLLEAKKFILIGKLLVIRNANLDIGELEKRLAFTKSIHRLLFQCNKNDLIRKIKNYDWNSVYNENFCVRIINNQNILIKKSKTGNKKAEFSEKSLAGHIWSKLKNPKVDLDNPKTPLTFFFDKNKVYCGLLLREISNNFDKRKSHLRPRPSPTSLHPKLARAMVNLTGIKYNGETIADLFCGSGGIPLEAGLMGFKTVANDINKKMLWKTLVNLRYYKIKDCRLMKKDILKISDKFDYVVSDLPYGLNSSVYYKNSQRKGKIKVKNNKKMIKELENFYLRILLKLKKIAKKKIILIFPHFVNYRKLIKKSGLKLKNEFSIYVHKSLTRRIVVLEN